MVRLGSSFLLHMSVVSCARGQSTKVSTPGNGSQSLRGQQSWPGGTSREQSRTACASAAVRRSSPLYDETTLGEEQPSLVKGPRRK